MEITEVAIKVLPPRNRPDGRLDDKMLAFANIVIDGAMAVHGMKVVRGMRGQLFVAMPDRKLEDTCPACTSNTALKDRHCRFCGARLADDRASNGPDGKPRHFSDVVHPIDAATRAYLEDRILGAYRDAVEEIRAKAYEKAMAGDEARPAPGPLAARVATATAEVGV